MQDLVTRRRIAAAAAACVVAAGALGTLPSFASPLDAYAWSARPLLIIAPRRDDARIGEQLARLAPHRDALADRKMPIIVATDDGVAIDGRAAPIDPVDLRRAYRVDVAEFAVLLIGKDTGVKFQSAEPTAAGTLFDLVDAMPMRREELRRRGE